MNRVTLIGELEAAPELRQSASGTAVMTLRLTLEELGRDGQMHTTKWRPVFFGQKWEKVAPHMRVGMQVMVDGSLQSSTYEKDGRRISKVDIVGREIKFL
jgi:single-strand DNA-binding protein